MVNMVKERLPSEEYCTWRGWQLGPRPHPSFFVICQVSRFVMPVGLQIFQDGESFHSAGRENGPSVWEMGYTFLKHIKPAISFKYLFFHFEILNYINFYAWRICWILYWYTFIFKISLNVSRNFEIKNSSDRTEICKISYNFLTVATIWAVMLTKRIWAPKKP